MPAHPRQAHRAGEHAGQKGVAAQAHVQLDAHGRLVAGRAAVKAAGVGDDQRVAGDGQAFAGRVAHGGEFGFADAEGAFGVQAVGVGGRGQALLLFPFQARGRADVRAACVGERAFVQRHVVQEQPGFGSAVEGVDVPVGLRVVAMPFPAGVAVDALDGDDGLAAVAGRVAQAGEQARVGDQFVQRRVVVAAGFGVEVHAPGERGWLRHLDHLEVAAAELFFHGGQMLGTQVVGLQHHALRVVLGEGVALGGPARCHAAAARVAAALGGQLAPHVQSACVELAAADDGVRGEVFRHAEHGKPVQRPEPLQPGHRRGIRSWV